MIASTRIMVRIIDYYFNEPQRSSDADILRFNHWRYPTGKCRNLTERHTLLIDLSADEEAIYAQIDREARRKVRQAEKEDLSFDAIDSPSVTQIRDFAAFYNEFASNLRLPQSATKRLAIMAASGALTLSRVRRHEEDLVWHAYLVQNGRARQMHSASLFRETAKATQRQQIGRANRLLHWKDIRHFKGRGLCSFDLGGWYSGTDNAALLRVNAFKQEFGGRPTSEFTFAEGTSFIGRVALQIQSRLH